MSWEKFSWPLPRHPFAHPRSHSPSPRPPDPYVAYHGILSTRWVYRFIAVLWVVRMVLSVRLNDITLAVWVARRSESHQNMSGCSIQRHVGKRLGIKVQVSLSFEVTFVSWLQAAPTSPPTLDWKIKLARGSCEEISPRPRLARYFHTRPLKR